MKVEFYSNTGDFLKDGEDILARDEAGNLLMLSLALRGRENTPREWLVAAVKDSGGAIKLCALCTVPRLSGCFFARRAGEPAGKDYAFWLLI